MNLDLFADANRWPTRPYCSDDKSARFIRSLSAAILRPYIQANPPHLRIWSIYDIDRAGGALAWERANLPPPSWAAANRENAHAHLVWGLSVPVLVDSPDMRQRPLRYLCAVEAAFRERLQADQGYSGLITKNPSHSLWRTWRGPRLTYELGELAEWVDLPKYLPKRKPQEIGIGRNLTVFDWLRQYAYRCIRHHKNGAHNLTMWQCHLNNKALDRNGDLQIPLDGQEIWHIAKSVGKWTWNRFDIATSDEKFSQLQAHRGRQSGISRAAANEGKRASARQMAAQRLSTRAIATELAVNQSTVVRWLK
ncbi:MAG TPA: replication initiation protein [Burkholderiaceae bacterium]|jgi:hypothetical protein